MRMSDNSTSGAPSDRQVAVAAGLAVGLFLIFVAVLLLWYVPEQTHAVDRAYREARKAGLDAVRSSQRELVTSYGWVDREKGIVRIPVDRAMGLVVRELTATEENPGVSATQSDGGEIATAGGSE